MQKQAGPQRATLATLHGVFDQNLGFPVAEPAWRDFFAQHRCDIRETADLDMMTARLAAHVPDFSFLPSANYFFLRADSHYRAIASTNTALGGVPVQSSVLVVPKQSPVTDWHQLRGAKLGFINTYCTTSFFAPSILIGREGLSLRQFFDAFPVPAWQGQIDAVLAGEIDATMVFEDVWRGTASNAETTRIIARIDGLPTAPMIVRKGLADDFVASFRQALLGSPAEASPGTLYAGFSDYQAASMDRFFAELERLPGMNKLGGGARV